jgi:hypothetical protein
MEARAGAIAPKVVAKNGKQSSAAATWKGVAQEAAWKGVGQEAAWKGVAQEEPGCDIFFSHCHGDAALANSIGEQCMQVALDERAYLIHTSYSKLTSPQADSSRGSLSDLFHSKLYCPLINMAELIAVDPTCASPQLLELNVGLCLADQRGLPIVPILTSGAGSLAITQVSDAVAALDEGRLLEWCNQFGVDWSKVEACTSRGAVRKLLALPSLIDLSLVSECVCVKTIVGVVNLASPPAGGSSSTGGLTAELTQSIFSMPTAASAAQQATEPRSTNKRRKPKVFLSHAWARDRLGRDNHARVKEMNELLKAEGVETWFDDQGDMQGDTLLAMTNGIDNADMIVVCITREYINKCKKEDNDNCKLEFEYAVSALYGRYRSLIR